MSLKNMPKISQESIDEIHRISKERGFPDPIEYIHHLPKAIPDPIEYIHHLPKAIVDLKNENHYQNSFDFSDEERHADVSPTIGDMQNYLEEEDDNPST